MKRNSIFDRIIMVISTAFISIPGFIMGTFLMLLFSVKLGLVPANGSAAKGLILPIITLGLSPMANVIRLTRSSMLDVLGQDYIRTAKAKGVSPKKIIFGHALKNALIAEYLAQALDKVGITMNLTNQVWNTVLETRKNGDYAIARNGWIADYNDACCFLDMWTTTSGNNDCQFGREGNASASFYNMDLTALGYDIKVENGAWAETFDVIIPLIKSCADLEVRNELMHIAEDILMSTGAINPLYFYTDTYMLSDKVEGFFANPLGYKFFMYCTVSEDVED